jgi:pyruvate dehydrogenase E1 component alpha subunit
MNLPLELARSLYVTMVRIREFEDATAGLVESGEARCPCHLYVGQEAIATAVCAALEPADYVWGGHRSHGHYLAKGGSSRQMMAEILGKTTGCCEGRGGSMHLFAPEVGVLGTVPLVAATIPLSVGAALASKLRGERRVSVAFFGDGAVEEGHFHESMNLAAVYRLPVIFICENNFYASHMALLERRAADNIVKSGDAHGIPSEAVDGNDVAAVYEAAARAVARGREGGGPTLIEARTYRWRGHVGASFDMDVGVKRKDELSEWLPRDPIARWRDGLIARGVSVGELDQIRADAAVEIADAIAFARSSPDPDPATLEDHVYVTSPAVRP